MYDLNPLLQKDFNFIYDPGSGIERVTVKKLRLSSRMKRGDRITVEADPSHNPDAVYDLLDQIRKSLRLNMYNVTQVELAASVLADADKPVKTVTIRITHPNSCSLRYYYCVIRFVNARKCSFGALPSLKPNRCVRPAPGFCDTVVLFPVTPSRLS